MSALTIWLLGGTDEAAQLDTTAYHGLPEPADDALSVQEEARGLARRFVTLARVEALNRLNHWQEATALMRSYLEAS